MVLCSVCTELTQTWLFARLIWLYPDNRQPGSFEPPLHCWHQPSWTALESAAKSCELCSLIVAESKLPPLEDRFGNMAILADEVKDEDAARLRFQVFGGARIEIFCKQKRLKIRLHVALDDDSLERAPGKLAETFTNRLVSDRVDDERTFANINRWINRCVLNHSQCISWSLQSQSRQCLPTRVIDVGTDNDEIVRLHISEANERSRYVALSYCWGHVPNPLMTTATNLESHIAGMKVAQMPRTYRDAVVITRKLGIRYLWIDALCIIQHDSEDWNREAATMDRVYSQATVTIAGHAAADTSTGLLSHRTPRHRTAVEVPWPYWHGPHAGSAPMRAYIVPVFNDFQDAMRDSPLSARSWTFQERALSTRFIHLAPDMVHWQCREAYIDESEAVEQHTVPYCFAQFNKKQELNSISLHSGWADVVEEFSKRSLSFEGDKLPALSGVARIYGKNGMLGTYFCGLWQDELLRHLLWHANREQPAVQQRPKKYRAPSWSWASIEGPIQNDAIKRGFAGFKMLEELGYRTRHGRKMLAVTSVTMTTAGPDGYGVVERAHLLAKGLLKTGVCRKLKDPEFPAIGARAIEGGMVGMAVMDVEVEDDSIDVWICPVLECRPVKESWPPSLFEEYEVLLLAEAPESQQKAYPGRVMRRLGKGRAMAFRHQPVELMDFTFI